MAEDKKPVTPAAKPVAAPAAKPATPVAAQEPLEVQAMAQEPLEVQAMAQEPLETLDHVYCQLAKVGVMQYDSETQNLWIGDRVLKTPLTKFVADAMVGGRLKQVSKAAYDEYVAKE
jgi:hypothetical protein